MRPLLLLAVGLVAAATPAAAQFNAYYEGTQLVDGKPQPVSTRIAIEKGRVILGMKGVRSSRMVFTEKDGMLRVIDDSTRTYLELARGDRERLASAVADMRKKMAQMPPGQRETAQKTTGGAIPGMNAPEAPSFVWSDQTQTVQGYQCTRVDVFRGGIKKAEYGARARRISSSPRTSARPCSGCRTPSTASP